MANPQPDKFTKVSNELFEAIIMSDFSKRQRNIIDLVLRMSYGCGKKSAILRPSDFEVVGILRSHIKKELEYLSKANVLHIQGDVIRLNKDYDTWRVSLARTFDYEKFTKILRRNLDDDGSQNGNESYQNSNYSYQNGNKENEQKVTETVTKVAETVTKSEPKNERVLPKWEQGSYQNSNIHVTKMVTTTAREPYSPNGFQAPKDIFKESIKEIPTEELSTLQDTERAADTAAAGIDMNFAKIYDIYEREISGGKISSAFEIEEFNYLYDEYGPDWMLAAIREAVRHKIKTIAYITGVLRGYRKRGGPDKPNDRGEDTDRRPAEPSPPVKYYVPEDDEITRRMLEYDRQLLEQPDDRFPP